jgi:hypothetical protein
LLKTIGKTFTILINYGPSRITFAREGAMARIQELVMTVMAGMIGHVEEQDKSSSI